MTDRKKVGNKGKFVKGHSVGLRFGAGQKGHSTPHTEETKKLISRNRIGKCLGKDNPKFKGGYIDKWGYMRICINGKQIKRARYVMGKYLRRKLLLNEDVHHKDENKLNDRIYNLEVLSKSAHTKYHFNNNPIKFRERYNYVRTE